MEVSRMRWERAAQAGGLSTGSGSVHLGDFPTASGDAEQTQTEN